MQLKNLFLLGLIILVSACSTPKSFHMRHPPHNAYPCVYQPQAKGGGFYKDDGPGNHVPAGIDYIREPEPKVEILHRYANRPYTVLGKDYTPRKVVSHFVEEGIGSWYGRKFHGQKTSSGEPYDMYAMTAAHPTLPIPSYVRVTNRSNNRQVIVRINDRGPFHKNRVIDLSFLAACRLGYAGNGSAEVRVESLLPGQHFSQHIDEKSIIHLAQTKTIAPLVEKPHGEIFIQLGAFSSRSNAESFQVKVAEIVNEPIKKIHLSTLHGITRVRMGPFKNKEMAIKEVERLTGDHHIQAVVVH